MSGFYGDAEPLVAVDGLTKRFPIAAGLFRKPSSFIHAVDDVSFRLGRGESLGLVGESGCGKTTVGKLLVKLQEPTAGSIAYRFPAPAVGGRWPVRWRRRTSGGASCACSADRRR